MSQYATIYRMEWQMMPIGDGVTVGDNIRVDISPTDVLIPDDDIPVIIPMQAGGKPLVVSVVDNDTDKFTPIKSKQAVIEVLSGNGIDINTFAVGSDNLWIVTAYFDPEGDNKTIFKGFLVLSDLQQAYLPDSVTVTLTASDHLGLLKDTPLLDFSDENPSGKYKIGQLIAMCLRKTGLDLNLRVINNLRHGGGQFQALASFNADTNTIIISNDYIPFFYAGQQITVTGTATSNGTYLVIAASSTLFGLVAIDGDITVNEDSVLATFTDTSSQAHIYHGTYIDSKSYESNIGECEDCYTVLTKILGEDCYLTQYLGEWWIVRLDEIENLSVYVALFNSLGEYQSIATEGYSKQIGPAEDHRFAFADQLLQLDRPHGFIKETYKFQYPVETICNIDYSRGDETADPDVQVDGYTSFDLDCWEAKRLWGDDAETPQVKAAILRTFNTLGDEEERFIMLTQPTTNEDAYNYILSSPVSMSQLDKFKFSFDVSSMTNPSGDGLITVCYVLLYGVDGNVYTLHEIDPDATWVNIAGEIDMTWKLTNEEFTLFRTGLQWAMFTDEDKTDWQNCVIAGAPLPVAGEIRFMLCAADQSSDSFDSFNVRYQNISLEYYPYLGGSYRKYTGFYNKVDRDDDDYIAKRDREVYIADSPKPLFKGAMFILVGSSYVLTSRWYTANTFALGYPPDPSYLHPYGWIQAYAVWNQYNLVVRKFSGSVLGFGTGWPDIIHKYSLTDTNPNADNRFFVMLSYEQDWKIGTMTAVLIEVYKTDIGHVYDDDHEFKYITQ